MSKKPESIDTLVSDMFLELKAPGLLCAVTSNAQVIHYAACGYANLSMKTPFSIEQSFPVGSLTKSFCAAAILLLRDQGHFALNQSPRDLIPVLPPFWSSVSLHQLLSMQSGLGADFGGSWAEQHLPLSNTELGERLAQPIIAAAAPDAAFLYSNFGYMMLGRVISEVSGQDARDFIIEKLLNPLEMRATNWAPPPTNAATGYRFINDTFKEERTFTANNYGGVFGGLWSTLPDMAVWMDFLCSAHVNGDSPYNRVLSKSSRLEIQRAVVLRPMAPAERDEQPAPCGAYGYGLVRLQGKTEWIVGHGGAVPGFGANMSWSPQTGVSVFAVANLRYAALTSGCSKILNFAATAAKKRRSELDPLLAQRANQIISLISAWDNNIAQDLFTESFFIDYPEEYISRRLGDLRSAVGKSPTITVVPHEGLSAKIKFDQGNEVTFTVCTLEPGQIQELEFGKA